MFIFQINLMIITWVLVVVLNHQILYTEEFDSFEGCQKQSRSKLIETNDPKAYAECRKIVK
jgi:hypothetical protein